MTTVRYCIWQWQYRCRYGSSREWRACQNYLPRGRRRSCRAHKISTKAAVNIAMGSSRYGWWWYPWMAKDIASRYRLGMNFSTEASLKIRQPPAASTSRCKGPMMDWLCHLAEISLPALVEVDSYQLRVGSVYAIVCWRLMGQGFAVSIGCRLMMKRLIRNSIQF